MVAGVVTGGLGIRTFGLDNECFRETAVLKVCAVTVLAGAKRPLAPTIGRRRRSPAADSSMNHGRRVRQPARHLVNRGYAAAW